LVHCPYFHQLFDRADAPWQSDEGIGKLNHPFFTATQRWRDFVVNQT
jgi:hypothetical protein